MSAASNYTEANIINALLRGVTFPLPTGTWVGLHTADPTDAGGSEVSTANWPQYARVKAEGSGSIGDGWDAPTDGVTQNSLQLTYPSMDGVADVTVTHWAIYDAATGGNMLVHSSLQTPRTLKTGDIFVFDIGSLSVTAS